MAFTNPRVAAAATSAVVALAVVATPADAAEPKAPKNIIYMVGDGMGYNHVAAANLWQTGQSKWMLNGENSINSISNVDGKPVQAFEQEDKGWKHTSMTTFQYGNEYDEIKAWSDRDWINKNFTDSAAAATAMGTGVKTDNGKIGVDHKGEKLENTSQRAVKQGKAAGVVSTVPFNHATPAGWGGHNENRSNYTKLADEMLGPDSPLSVIMGAGHPLYDDNAQKPASSTPSTSPRRPTTRSPTAKPTGASSPTRRTSSPSPRQPTRTPRRSSASHLWRTRCSRAATAPTAKTRQMSART